MSPVDSFPAGIGSQGHDPSSAQAGIAKDRYRSERRDRSFVRRALRRGLATQEIENRLLTATEFHRLNPERDVVAYVRGLIDEEGSSPGNISLAQNAADAREVRDTFVSEVASAERASESEAVAQRYIHENFDSSDWLALVVRNRKSGETIQRIATAQQIAGRDFQSWLRHKNAHGSDIYLSLNTLKEHAHGRTKGDVKEIRHLYLDLDAGGPRKLAAIYEDAALPHPNYVLQTSPEKYQVIWRVDGITQSDAEHLLRDLARQFGGDPAATDVTRVFRLPGFNNKKYEHNFPVRLVPGTMPDPVYRRADFAAISQETETAVRATASARTVAGPEFANSQSERDWAYAIRHLRRGDDPDDIVREITSYRTVDRCDSADITKRVDSRKPNPRYYAEHTVARAMAYLGMTRSPNAAESRSPENERDR